MVKTILSIFFALCLCACVSSGRVDGDILEHQAEIDRLESELRSRDRAVDNAVRRLESITERSTGMEGTVDDIIELFDEYQRTVEQLLRDYRAEGSPGEASVQSIYNTTNHQNLMYDCWIYTLCKRNKTTTVA